MRIGFGTGLRFLVKRAEVCLKNDGPALHGKMRLRADGLVLSPCLFQKDVGGGVTPKTSGHGGQWKYTDANALANFAYMPSSIAHGHRDGLFMLPRLHQHGDLHTRTSGCERDDVSIGKSQSLC